MFFFKQKTAYEMRIRDWSSDGCSSDLHAGLEELSDDAAAPANGVEAELPDDLEIAAAVSPEEDLPTALEPVQHVEHEVSAVSQRRADRAEGRDQVDRTRVV